MSTPRDDTRQHSVVVTTAHMHTFELPLRRQLRNANTQHIASRKMCVIALTDDEGNSGYGEVCALPEGMYVGPSIDITIAALETHLTKRLVGQSTSLESLDLVLGSEISRNCYARSGVEAALWHLVAQRLETPLWRLWGGTNNRVHFGTHLPPAGATDLHQVVERCAQLGSKRLRVKVSSATPQTNLQTIEYISKISNMDLAVDCNGSFDPQNKTHLEQLYRFEALGVSLIEQPFDHSRKDCLEQTQHLSQTMSTAIALDESIGSLEDLSMALDLRACSAINIKAPRMGGFDIALRAAQLARSHSVEVWCGGMYETGIGRVFNLNLMTRSEFGLPGDGDPPSVNYETQFTEPDVQPANGYYTVNETTVLGGWKINLPKEI